MKKPLERFSKQWIEKNLTPEGKKAWPAFQKTYKPKAGCDMFSDFIAEGRRLARAAKA